MAGVLIAAAGILVYYALVNFRSVREGVDFVLGILSPFFFAFVFAFLLNLPMSFFERRITKLFTNRKKPAKPRPRLIRALSLLFSIAAVLALIFLLFVALIPQLLESLETLIRNIPDYIINLQNTANALLARYHIDNDFLLSLIPSTEKILSVARDLLSLSAPAVLSFTTQLVSGVVNVFVGLIVCIYFLMSKEIFFAQAKKILYALFKEKTAGKTLEVIALCNKTFTGFISGKIIDSILVGILCFMTLWAFHMPYSLLISVIIAVANIIPFFGPIIGAVPALFITLIVDPPRALLLLVILVVIQQFDGNVMAPRILGDSTGLPAIWVMFAIFLGGGLFGLLGMLVSVPFFAVLYTLFQKAIEKKLVKKGLPIASESYRNRGKNANTGG